MREQKLTGYPSIDKPWLKYYSQEVIDTPLPECTMYEHIFNCNQDNLNRIAIDYYGIQISYGQMFQEISYLAGTLENNGIKKGDIVTVCMVNSPETVFLIFALNKIGAVANMVCGFNTCGELKKCIIDVKSELVFIFDSFLDKFEQIADEIPVDKIVVAKLEQSMAPGERNHNKTRILSLPENSHFISWEQFFSHKAESFLTCHDAAAPAVITYTGGTTGGSKGAMLSNKAVIAVTQQYITGQQELWRDSIWMQILPLFIAYGVTCSLMIPLIVGTTLVVRIPMTESIAELCKKFRPNHIMWGPAYWEAFAETDENIDLSNLIAPISGGDVLIPEAETRINEYLKKHNSRYCIMNGYGMTEVGATVSVNFQHAHKLGSVGIPFVRNVISAFDMDTGEELKYGQKGEICIQTPSTMLEYINDSEETNKVIKQHQDGTFWVHSGDLGYITEDGFVYISGRLKRYTVSLLEGVCKKIFSVDIEKVLLKHPKVEKCAVVSVEDKVTEHAPAAFIIWKKGFCSEENLEEIDAYAQENLEAGYRPVKYFVVDKFPLTRVGKIDYLTLENIANAKNEK